MTVSDTPPRSALRDLLIEYRAGLTRGLEQARADALVADAVQARRTADVAAYEADLHEVEAVLVAGSEINEHDTVTRLLIQPGPSALVLVDKDGVRWLATMRRDFGPPTAVLSAEEGSRRYFATWPMTIVAVAR